MSLLQLMFVVKQKKQNTISCSSNDWFKAHEIKRNFMMKIVERLGFEHSATEWDQRVKQ